MRLKQVKLNGFKSFCDSTVFNFQEKGITMVVGPNGCGKSNVVDAVRWALGEQSPKLMRGSAMSDVIFSGSGSRKPVGRAEVTLLFDNSAGTALDKYNEFSEIAVTRRIYRSGESEYLINKLPSRLLDVRELVMDTGAAGRSYAIVEQGRVDEFVTASPNDRRAFMEEAAGIMRFKTRRIAAEKKLEQTRQNLLRVEDVLSELNRQEGVLRDQMELAREFRALQTEAGSLQGDLVRIHHGKSARAYEELEGRREGFVQEAAGMTDDLNKLAAQAEALKLDQTRQEASLRESRSAVFSQDREIQENEKRMALVRQNQDHTRDWIANMEQTLEELRRRTIAASEQAREGSSELSDMETAAESIRVKLVQLEAQNEQRRESAQAMTARLTASHEELMASHANLQGIEKQQEMLEERLAGDEQRRTTLNERMEEIQQEFQDLQASLAAARVKAGETAAEMETQSQRVAELRETLQDRQAALEQHRRREEETTRETVECRSRLETLVEIEAGYQGFGENVRTFLQWADDHPDERKALGIIAPLSDLVTVPPEIVEGAADFLAPHLESIVLEQAQALPDIARRLEELDAGGIRFLALDALPAPLNGNSAGVIPSNENGDGAVTLGKLLEFSGEASDLGKRLFGATHILPAGAGPHPLPEPLGQGRDWISRDGAFSIDSRAAITLGKSGAPAAGVLQRKSEIASLESHLEVLEEKKTSLRAEGEAMETLCEELAAQIRSAEESLSGLGLTCKELEREISHAEKEGARLEQVRENMTREFTQFDEEISRLRAKREELAGETGRWKEVRERLEGGLTSLRAEEEQARNLAVEAADELTDTRVEHERVRSRMEALQTRLADLKRESQTGADKLEETETGLRAQQEKLAGFSTEIEEVKEKLVALHQELEGLRKSEGERKTVFDKMTEQIEKEQRGINAARSRLEGHNKLLHDLDLEWTKQKVTLEQFIAQLAELPPRREEEELGDESTVVKRLSSVQARLGRMEGVNLGAPEEYEALDSRLSFLNVQREDLGKAIEDLESSIRRMNAESRRRFKETFEKVNEKFQELFPKVFGGGEARLVLTDSDDPLLAGVDIVAQPPGKKLQRLNLLSGGEKALTAISLIFSFFMYKPSPFCLLDEVDAPLDDVNVTRFNNLVQNMTEQSQFIIITHNKRTMEVADRMYGVTMEEAGVSKIVSVNLS